MIGGHEGSGGFTHVPDGTTGAYTGGNCWENYISWTYEGFQKAPFSVTLSEPFFGEFVTENVIRAF